MSELTTAARPYARAVLELARESESLNTWSDRLQLLSAIVTDSDMTKLLDRPDLTAVKKAEMLSQVANDQLDENGNNFVKLLAENGRLSLLSDIAILFEEYRSEEQGSIDAVVTSAYELDDAQTEKIANALGKRLDRKVNVISNVDSSLIGGAIIRAGDLVIDGSLKGRLSKLTSELYN